MRNSISPLDFPYFFKKRPYSITMKGLLISLLFLLIPAGIILFILENQGLPPDFFEFLDIWNLNFSFTSFLPLFLVGAFYFHKKQLAKTRASWQKFAYRNGFEHIRPSTFKEFVTKKDAPSIYGEAKGSFRTPKGYDSYLHLKLETRTSGTSNNKQTKSYCVLIFTIPGLTKDLYLSKRIFPHQGFMNSIRSNILAKTGFEEYQTGDLAFDEKYNVTCRSGSSCSSYLSSEVIQKFIELPSPEDFAFSISNSQLTITFNKTPTTAETIETAYNFGAQVLDILLPQIKDRSKVTV